MLPWVAEVLPRWYGDNEGHTRLHRLVYPSLSPKRGRTSGIDLS
jgi:hypothetical protein